MLHKSRLRFLRLPHHAILIDLQTAQPWSIRTLRKTDPSVQHTSLQLFGRQQKQTHAALETLHGLPEEGASLLPLHREEMRWVWQAPQGLNHTLW